MSGWLFNGEPSWSGDPAPRRPTLHARCAGEWGDAIVDAGLELAFAWLEMPCPLKERALRRGAIAAAQHDPHAAAHREIVNGVVLAEVREYLTQHQQA
jgi:hypothetical protein